MASNWKLVMFAKLFALTLGIFLAMSPRPCGAQSALSQGGISMVRTEATTADSQSQSTDQTTAPKSAAVADRDWHLVLSPYLWFPGAHGTVGARGLEASIHASAADLLSQFRFGLMGEADIRYKRVLMPIDMMWIRLGDEKALPFPDVGQPSAEVKATEFLLTPKIGYRIVSQEKLTIDALTGFRYWHVGQNLQFDPSGLEFSGSLNWVDPLVGGRIQGAVSPKLNVTIAGDVGGWGAGSRLDYHMVGLLGYRIKPTWTLQVGYRYLDVDYRSEGNIFDTTTSGVVFGVSIIVK